MLIGCVYGYLSFLFKRIDSKKIASIILFGSVARNEFDEKSDIDIFIDVADKKDENEIRKAADMSLSMFYRSAEYDKWKMLGVKNTINVQVGMLKEWELKDSVEKDGIMLYGTGAKSFKKYIIIQFKPIKDVKTRNRVIRKLFGRRERFYSDSGIVAKIGGEIIDKRVFIIPAEKLAEIETLLYKEGVDFRIKEVWM